MVVSQRSLEELSDVLARERLRRYGPSALAEAHVRRAGRVGVWIKLEGEPERLVSDDPEDDYLVALALESNADYLVSGGPHLAEAPLGEGAISMLTPRQFVELLERGSL